MRKQLKQLAVGAMTAVLTVTSLPLAAIASPNGYQAGGAVQAQASASSAKIGNGAIERTFSIENGKLKTTKLNNKRASKEYTPAEGSEEFIIRTTKTDADMPKGLDKSKWTVSTNSEETQGEGDTHGFARNLIDGNPSTIWHTAYQSSGARSYPYHVLFDLKGEQTFEAFSYSPRTNFVEVNGNIKGYELYVSNSETKLDANSEVWGQPVAKGSFGYEDGTSTMYVNLERPVTARQVKFVATSSKNGQQFAGGSEFDLYAKKIETGKNTREFKASDLTVKGQPKVEATSATINGQKKSGKKLSVEYNPYKFKDVDYSITENYVMYDGDHYMRKYLDIAVPEDQASKAEIDYIDLESMNVTEDKDTTWTIPTGKGGIVAMNEFRANLGQPYYIDGMFFGCEFPETDTQIVKNNARSRYYTGKTMERLVTDHQAGKGEDGKVHYNTWQTVAGAARNEDKSVIQADFFDYIDDISVPTEFRIQYNSWFDNMLEISDENILNSFIEIDRELNKVGTRPLDSYVMDDGWINYNDGVVKNPAVAGNTVNKTGFWEFNSKFPKELAPSVDLVDKFGSNYGLWIGPRGGYSRNGDLANIIQKSGKGTMAAGSIDVADRTYVENFKNMACGWQTKYHINYWKWDGFADGGQYGAFPAADGVPGRSVGEGARTQGHMTGGKQGMYHVTDLWEAWIDLFEAVRENARQNNIPDLWISLTCYVNPSPWFLQWANSVWLQCGPDQAGAQVNGSTRSDSQMDRQLDARDAAYYDYLKQHEFQFPLAHIYNHDPIYGKAGTGIGKTTATPEQFQNYLYSMAGRGTSFWELYFSDSILDDAKYEVVSEYLKWAEANHHFLRNAKMFGGNPATGIKLETGPSVTSPTVEINCNGPYETYGYSGFDGDEGILTIRNAEWRKAQKIDFTFDDATLGVHGNKGDTYKYYVERHYVKQNSGKSTVPQTGTFTYGDKVSWNLLPEESLTVRVVKNKETKAPKIAEVRKDGSNKLTVVMSEKVKGNAQFTINGKAVEAGKVEASADDMTFHIELDKALESGSKVEIAVSGVTDMAGNAVSSEKFVTDFHKDGVVASRCFSRLNDSAKKVASAEKSLQTASGFSVSSIFEGAGHGALVKQEGAYELGVDEAGKAYFTVNGATATADAVVNDGKKHDIYGVKENNGILKLYVDGQLAKSAYKKENATFKTPAAQITLGSKGLSGKASAKVYDFALGYDAVAKKHEAVAPDTTDKNLAKNKVPEAKWTSDNTNAAKGGDCPMDRVTDGRKDTNNYGEFGTDQRAESSYLHLDLGKVYELSQINLWRYFDGRTYENTTIVVSEDDKFDAKDTIVYNSDAENKNKFGKGTDKSYPETAQGHKFPVKAGTKARYVRVYMNGAKLKDGSKGNTNHVVELEVMGHAVSEQGQSLDTQKLYDRIDALKAEIATGKYTTSSVAKLQEKLDAAELVADCGKTQADVDKALDSLKDVEKLLVLRANIDKAQELLDKVNGLKPEDYTEESFGALAGPKKDVEDAIKDTSDLSQAELDKLVGALQDAVDGLKKVVPMKPIEPGKPNKPQPEPQPDPDENEVPMTPLEPAKPAQKPSKPNKPAKPAKPNKGNELPQSGDSNFVAIVLAAAAGVVLLGAGIIVSKRRGMQE